MSSTYLLPIQYIATAIKYFATNLIYSNCMSKDVASNITSNCFKMSVIERSRKRKKAPFPLGNLPAG